MRVRRILVVMIFEVIFASAPVMAQADPPDSNPTLSGPLLGIARRGSHTPTERPAKANPLAQKPNPQHFSKAGFVFLSTVVYGAAIIDMQRTLEVKRLPWWHETDPLAKPLVRLPAPAYYATGLALATSVNWFSWRMAHSRRWRKLSVIPQLIAISGNLYGYSTNRY
jgi:hypothetical protein